MESASPHHREDQQGETGVRRTPLEHEGAPSHGAAASVTSCRGGLVEKVRHLVPVAGRTWEVDVFLGANRGLVIAEVELDHAHEDIDLPPWIGREVTSDPRYGNSSLARAPFSTWVSAAAACPKPKWTRTDPSPRRLRPPRQDVTDAAAPWLGAPSCSSGVRLTPVSPC